jgi:TolA-binding protein
MTRPNLKQHVEPELGQARIDAQWTRIAERLPVPRRLARPLSLAAVGMCVAALALVWVWQADLPSGGSVWEGSRVASEDAPVDVSLAEGTHIELDPRSEVQLLTSSPHTVQMELRAGSARFDVAKRRARRFSVHAGAVEVLVTGTQFRVTRSQSGQRVHVTVEEGSVEVRRAGAEAVRLAAGESWTVEEPKLAVTPPKSVVDEPWVDSGEVDEPGEEPASPDARERRRARRRERDREQAQPQPAPASPAQQLFERANVARRAGLLREAAGLFDELVAQHPQDRHAALSAFELGRMRMDSFGDMRGAVEALERALALDSRRAFAEDALARLTLAHEALGDARSCARARERYLARYPEGVHARYLLERCVSTPGHTPPGQVKKP